MSSPGWPARLAEGAVALRPPGLRDGPAWVEVRLRNETWLDPWEATAPEQAVQPWPERQNLSSFAAMVRTLRRQARNGEALPFVVTWQGSLAGMLTVGSISRGAARTGSLGYWVDRRQAGQGITPTAVALAVDHCFGPAGLHRLEAWVRPENQASRRVLEKLGFREEGLAKAALFVDGAWRDHLICAVLPSDVPEGVVSRWRASRRTVA
jgi:ribosomal-protein-alanine N-acetyltransferase